MNRTNKHPRLIWSVLTVAVHLGVVSMINISTSHRVYAAEDSSKSYHVPEGSLATVLNEFVQRAGTSIAVDAKQLDGLRSSGLRGRYDITEGFKKILSPLGFRALPAATGYVIVRDSSFPPAQVSSLKNKNLTNTQNKIMIDHSSQQVIKLAPMVIYGIVDQDTQGYDDVYEADISSVYADKEHIERYKGAAPADLFRGMVGVYSGDARNSGAIDPNVRGIQGPGRVPVTVDGTEQAITIWRGYNGANNRNYIDPNLISNIQVIKGPSIVRNVNTSVGGAVVIKTLKVDDVLKDDVNFGGEIKLEGSNNSIAPRLPTLLTGTDYRTLPEWTYGTPYYFYDSNLYIQTRTDKDNKIFSSDDVAARIAVAGRFDELNMDSLFAYAYRDKGNHFAGKKNADFFSGELGENNPDFIPYLAKAYPAGSEVPNTSNRMESYLIKWGWNPTDSQRLELGYRDSNTIYGEIMPSRIAWYSAVESGVPQWPLSEVNAKAYNLEYKWQPEELGWIDFYSNIWQTDTVSRTYSSGGLPNEVRGTDWSWDRNDPTSGDWSKSFPIRNTAVAHADNIRKGVTVSNKFNILDRLDLTLGASFQKEKLTSDDIYNQPETHSTWRMFPRAGRREEKQLNFNFDYRPLSWLSFSAGGRYQSYWAFDDFLNNSLNNNTLPQSLSMQSRLTGVKIRYGLQPERTAEEQQELQQKIDEIWQFAQQNNLLTSDGSLRPEHLLVIKQYIYSDQREVFWSANTENKMDMSNHPFYSGQISGDYFADAGTPSYEYIPLTEVHKKKDSGWTPALSVSIQLNPESRFYLRYSEILRMPSIFESTVGFSANLPFNNQALKPEHIYNYEVAYVQHFDSVFTEDDYTDIKLAYFYNKTKNVIERDMGLFFSNLDRQTLSGLELQARYDNGHFFGDISAQYQLKNEVCDRHNTAMLYSNSMKTAQLYNQKIELINCIRDGYPDGYLLTMATPELAINTTVGRRFFDNKLEFGGRITFNKAYDSYVRKSTNLAITAAYQAYVNAPLKWDDTWLFDAYVNYRYRDNTRIELMGSNLGNEFYIDPLTRSPVAAPGRTLKLSLTHKF